MGRAGWPLRRWRGVGWGLASLGSLAARRAPLCVLEREEAEK